MAVDIEWDRVLGTCAVAATVIAVLGLLWLTGTSS
jgi:hypothetical protein